MPPPPPERLDASTLSWTALLGKWTQFAQASLALPDDAEGERWRQCVPPIITLQAVTFALAELESVPAADRAVARDRAEVLITDAVRRIEQAWDRTMLPPMLHEIIHDARLALEYSIYAGVRELVWPGPESLVMPEVDLDIDAGGTLAIMMPGTIAMPGEPVAWWVDRPAVHIDGCTEQAPDGSGVRQPRQVYRRIDETTGCIVGDTIAPLDETLPSGMPLLVPLLDRGQRIGRFTMSADEWLARQRAAMPGERIPVEIR